jgi:hypothetical protein
MKSRLQLLIEISLFYPLILETISSATDKDSLVLKWGFIIFCLIITHLCSDYFIDHAQKWAKSFANLFIILSLLSFGAQLYLLAFMQGMLNVSYITAFLFGLSTISIVTFPAILLLLIAGYVSIHYFSNSFKKAG